MVLRLSASAAGGGGMVFLARCNYDRWKDFHNTCFGEYVQPAPRKIEGKA